MASSHACCSCKSLRSKARANCSRSSLSGPRPGELSRRGEPQGEPTQLEPRLEGGEHAASIQLLSLAQERAGEPPKLSRRDEATLADGRLPPRRGPGATTSELERTGDHSVGRSDMKALCSKEGVSARWQAVPSCSGLKRQASRTRHNGADGPYASRELRNSARDAVEESGRTRVQARTVNYRMVMLPGSFVSSRLFTLILKPPARV